MNILFTRQGGSVKRFHTHRTIQTQTVAAHSWGVAVILFQICPKPSLNLIKAALLHDMAEYVTGDVPATAKWSNAALAHALMEFEIMIERIEGTQVDLTVEEHNYLKFADMLEFMWFVAEELSMGNSSMLRLWENGLKWFAGYEPLNQEVTGMLEEMTSIAAKAKDDSHG